MVATGLKDFGEYGEVALLGFVMFISTAIACFIGCSSKQLTLNQYLHGGKQMSTLPIAISFIGSVISGMTLLAVPSEVYFYGTQFLAMLFSLYIAILVIIFFLLPKLYDHQFNSLNELIEKRFNKTARIIVSMIFVVKLVLFTPLVIYLPAASFSNVAHLPIQVTTFFFSIVCVLYTIIGGFKGMVWTTVWQTLWVFISLMAVVYVGCRNVGSLFQVLEIASNGSRLELFNGNPDPFARNTFWTITIGMCVNWFYFLCSNPGSYQKLVSLPSKQKAVRTLIWFGVFFTVLEGLIVLVGLIIYAEFNTCDPYNEQRIKGPSQLLVYYMKIKSLDHPILGALFLAGILSATLSAMSFNLNTAAGIVYEDFFKVAWSKKIKENKSGFHLKCITAIIGVISVLMTLNVQNLDSFTIELLLNIHRIVDGALLAVFLIALFCRPMEPQSVIVSVLVSISSIGWIVYKASFYKKTGDLKFTYKPMSVIGCSEDYIPRGSSLHNLTEVSEGVLASKHVPKLYQLSFYHYTSIGIAITLILSTIWNAFASSVQEGRQMDDLVDVAAPFKSDDNQIKKKVAEKPLLPTPAKVTPI